MLYKKFPKEIKKIFIDLDDTLVDFVGAAYELYYGYKSKSSTELLVFWNRLGNNDFQCKLWDKINEIGPPWWTNLKSLPWADELLETAHRACKDVVILTSPGCSMASANAIIGKIAWSINKFSDNLLVLTHKKHMCSSPGSVLIDDWDKFLVPWEKYGGTAIKMRRDWHTAGYYPGEIIDALHKYSKG